MRIVPGALLGVGEDFVRGLDLSKFPSRILDVVKVSVWVQFKGFALVRFADPVEKGSGVGKGLVMVLYQQTNMQAREYSQDQGVSILVLGCSTLNPHKLIVASLSHNRVGILAIGRPVGGLLGPHGEGVELLCMMYG